MYTKALSGPHNESCLTCFSKNTIRYMTVKLNFGIQSNFSYASKWYKLEVACFICCRDTSIVIMFHFWVSNNGLISPKVLNVFV